VDGPRKAATPIQSLPSGGGSYEMLRERDAMPRRSGCHDHQIGVLACLTEESGISRRTGLHGKKEQDAGAKIKRRPIRTSAECR
jgi:hypothetical protein